MARYFHLLETGDGRWACRHGMHEYDSHDDIEEAREHIHRLATESGPASIFRHYLGGTVEHVEDV